MAYEPQISAATLAGSLLSCIATAAVLVSFVVYRREQRSFRHVLILNLTLSEFTNSLNNSISGIVKIRNQHTEPGLACTVNGFVGQLSVQAADFSIFAIAVVTVLTVTRRAFLPAASRTKKVFLALSVWIVPLFTSIFSTAQGAMAPVAGNWCWITASRPDLRYAMTHGWRFFIIFGTIIIYAYTWWYMSRHFHSLVKADRTGFSKASVTTSSTSTTSSSGNTIRTGTSTMSTLVSSPTSLKKGLSFKRSIRSVISSKAADDGVQALPDSAARPDANETSGRELEVFSDGQNVPTIRLEKPPPTRGGPRSSGHGFGLSYLQEENKNLLSPPPARTEHMREEPTTPVTPLPPPPHLGSRKSVVSWQLPAMPPSPKGSWRQHFKEFGVGQGSPSASPLAQRPLSIWPKSPRRDAPWRYSKFAKPQQSPRWEAPWRDTKQPRQGQQVTLMTNVSEFPMRRQTRNVEREIKRMMLLNAYPIFYVLLSVPGLVNRLIEAAGVTTSSTTAQALQAPTQFIGLANALTYGFNKHIRHRIKDDWRMLRGREP